MIRYGVNDVWLVVALWLSGLLIGLVPAGLYAWLGGRAVGMEPLIGYGCWCLVVTAVAVILLL